VYLLVSLGVIIYCSLAAGRALIIKNGFDEPLCVMLHDEYSITIPEDAEFIKGKHTGFNDNTITVFFKLPANGRDVSEVICPMLGEDTWIHSMHKHIDAEPDSYAEMAMEYSHTSSKAYTSIEHTDIRDDGYVYVLFHGWRPSMKGVDTKIDW